MENRSKVIIKGWQDANRQSQGMSYVNVRPLPKPELTSRQQEVARLYISVFEGPPWFERYIVSINGNERRFGSPEELKALSNLFSNGAIKESDVRVFYTLESVCKSICTSSSTSSFIASIATIGDIIIGVSWGMASNDIPSREKLEGVRSTLRGTEVPSERVFYFDETFVDKDFRNRGIGTSLVIIRSDIAKASGYTHAVARTINEAQVQVFGKVFGRENVQILYQNPSDIQADRRYYLIDIRRT